MINLTAIKNIKKRNLLAGFKKDFKHVKKDCFEEEKSQVLVEIGHKLKRFREKNSICLERVAVVTMIRINLLEAIEEGNLEKLPEPIYIQGLIKRYADAMGLNGEQLASLFPTKKAQEITRKPDLNLSLPQLRPYHLYFLYILIIIISVGFLPRITSSSYFLGREKRINNSEKQQAQEHNQTTLLAQAAPDTHEIESNPQKYTAEKVEKKSVVVNVIVKEESWVSIEIDGKKEFEGSLPRGTRKTWAAQKQLVFLAGNAGGILIAFNNGQTMQLGKTGSVEQVVFAATDTQISQFQKTN